jgi:putative spermidine/putrescine transport system permease protein
MEVFVRRRLGWATLWAYGVLVIAFLLTPLVVLIAMSFSSTALLTFPPVGFSLKWYPAALGVSGVIDSFILSVGLALASAILSAVFGTLAAIAMANRRFPGRGVITSFFLSPLVFPSIVIGVALLQYYRTLEYDDVFVGLLLGHIVVTMPYTIRTVTASLDVFDYSLLDAAKVLGADTVRTFVEVMLPIIKPGVFAGAVFAFLISFDNYTVSMFLADAQNVTLPIRIFNYAAVALDPTVAAISSLMIVVSVLMFIAGGRLIGVRGLARF